MKAYEFEKTIFCRECGFHLWNPIINLGVSSLGLYDDARFPGRCILMYEHHETQYDEMNLVDQHRLFMDAALVGKVLKEVLGAPRINYAVLGNAVDHIHYHIIPRYPDREPRPKMSPWNDPRDKVPFEKDQKDDLIKSIRSALQERFNHVSQPLIANSEEAP